MIRDGFKAHRAELGPKLGQSQASGLSRLARLADGGGVERQVERVELARARVRAEIEARRGLGAGAARGASSGEPTKDNLNSQERTDRPVRPPQVGIVGGSGVVDKGERGVAERGTGCDVGEVKASAVQSTEKKGGRPRLVEGEPWVAAGVSRRTWERRRKATKVQVG